MLKNYLKIALRTLKQHPVFSAINVVGLSLGMSVCLLIIVLVVDQRSYDQFHQHKERIYRVTTASSTGAPRAMATSPGYIGPRLASDLPAVEHVVRMAGFETNAVHEGESLPVEGLYAEAPFFDVFSFELVAGDPRRALAEPNQVVLSDVTAEKLFGEANPLGEVVTLEHEGDFTVAGVVATRGLKSHLTFDVLTSFETVTTIGRWKARMANIDNAWSYANYVLLREKASVQPVRAYLEELAARHETNYEFGLQALTDIALGPVMRNHVSAHPTLPLVLVLFLGGLGVVVMLTAGFNYVGLTVARYLQRAREVGLRKAIGAHRHQIVAQFLGESVILAFGALVGAFSLLTALIPWFNDLSVVAGSFGIHLSPAAVFDVRLIGLFVLFSVLVGLLAGLYPAFYLSRFEPARVLTDAGRAGREGRRLTLRKTLIALQLTLTLALVITTVLLYEQFDHMVETDFGFETTNLISVDLQGNDYAMLKDELLRDASILEVGVVSELPGIDGGIQTSISRPGRGDSLSGRFVSVTRGFFDVFDLQMVVGEPWREGTAGAAGVILNERAVRQLGFDRPAAALGEVVESLMLHQGEPIVGVVADFRVTGPGIADKPLMLVRAPSFFSHLVVRIQPNEAARALDHLKKTWQQVDPVHPVAIGFYDAQLLENESVQTLLSLLNIVGPIAAIVLAILGMGLVGLATYSVHTRTKEVGIRKVMGASVPSVIWLLSKEFLLLLACAVVLAVPLAWFANNVWLLRIGDRVDFGVSIFAAGIGLVGLVVLAIVGAQTARAALADPVESLRYE